MVSSAALHRELWTSWASLLRSYAAAHGLNAAQHAVVEVSAESITLRAGTRWRRFTPSQVEGSDQEAVPFCLQDDGCVRVGNDDPEEMDFVAERFARELLL